MTEDGQTKRALPRRRFIQMVSGGLGLGAGALMIGKNIQGAVGPQGPPGTSGPHNILSTTHSDTIVGSVIAGDIIYGNATPSWTRLAKGSNGQKLKLASGLPSWADVDFSELTGGLSDSQHGARTVASAHRHADLASIGVDDHHTRYHEANHISGGADAFLSTDILEAIGKRLRETGGPTTLLMGAVADGQLFQRSGTSIVGFAITREDLIAMWTRQSTKTNVATTFVDIYTDANSDGESVRVDFTGKTQYSGRINWNKIGTGTQNVRCVDRDNLANVLFDVVVVSGPNIISPTALPGWATGVKNIKLQTKSTLGTDDPVFESCNINLV